ncbi:MAG: hypothetical protein ABI194_05405 [Gemmatimonadaceae bacterium]
MANGVTSWHLHRRTTYKVIGAVAVAAAVTIMALERRAALHDEARRDWARRSSAAVKIARGSARGWLAEHAAAARLLGASAART